MMAMTPYEKKTLDEIEHAFLETVESRVAPSAHVATKKATTQVTTARRRGWFSGLTDRMVNAFVCCAPPQSLLDDEEIQAILATIEAPAPVKPVKTLAFSPRAPSRKDLLMRRSSASVTPASCVAEAAQIDHVTSCEEEAPVVEDSKKESRAHVSLGAMQRVIVTLLALQKTVETRQTERAVLAVQMKWRRRQVAPIAPPTAAPTSISPALSPTPTNTTEPDVEPTVDSTPALSSPKRRHTRVRKPRANKKTKFAFIPAAATQETTHAVDAVTQLALTRKRLRSVDLESRTPRVDVERTVHVLFGEEEIDEEEEDDHEVSALKTTWSPRQSMPCFTLQRCASVPPPLTAFRPRAIKSKFLLESQAASTIQCVWRNVKGRREQEIQRRLVQYEIEKQSVMPTIRDKMTLLRKRLAEIQERNSGTIVVVDEPTVIAPVDDDFDWL